MSEIAVRDADSVTSVETHCGTGSVDRNKKKPKQGLNSCMHRPTSLLWCHRLAKYRLNVGTTSLQMLPFHDNPAFHLFPAPPLSSWTPPTMGVSDGYPQKWFHSLRFRFPPWIVNEPWPHLLTTQPNNYSKAHLRWHWILPEVKIIN